MEAYVFKFSACLGIFWLVYILFLEHQKMHRLKRFYLLGSFATSLIIPLLTITYYIEPTPVRNNFEVSPLFTPIEPSFIAIPQEIPPFWDFETILWFVYGLGVLLFSVRFIINLVTMYLRISKNENIVQKSFIYILLKECRIPHSFFKYLFFNEATYESGAIPKEVILHEETHARQLHSLDIIIVEVLQIAFWYHPLIYILKHNIKLNHEFLADQAVLDQGTDTKAYQKLLLHFSSNTAAYQLSSAINYSSIKKRFTVMKTHTSKTRIWVSSLLLLPIIAILFYSFSEKEYVEKENSEISKAIATELEKANELQQIYTDGATEAMMQEYNDWIKASKKSSTLFIPLGKIERLAAIYDLMSEAQRNSVEPYPLLQEITPDLYSVTPSLPTAAQFESWKNETEFAIWLDGKHISNSELNNYKTKDIAHYVGSSVHSNAKSKKNPEPFQFSLYTQDGFQKFYTESFVNDYRTLNKTYSNAINTYLKGSQTDNSELRILKAQADKFYNQFTKEDLHKYSILPTQVLPTVAQENQIKILKTNKNKNIILLEHWYITIDNNKYYYPYKKGDLKKYYDKYGNEVDLDVVKEYVKKHKTFETLKSTGKHYVYKSTEEQKQMNTLFSDLGGMYFRMPRDNKAKVKRPISPSKPYVQITLNGKTYYKKRNELTAQEIATFPPPPPPPQTQQKNSKGGPNFEDSQDTYNPSFLEYIVEMENDGAFFYLDDKKISAKEAKSLATNNKGKRTEMITQVDTNGNYLVKISSIEKNNSDARRIELKILNNSSYLIDGIKATKGTFTDVFNQLHQDITPEVRTKTITIHVSSSQEISNKEVWFIYNALQDYGFYRIITPSQEINRAKGNIPFAIESRFSTQEKATEKQLAQYNAWAKNLNSAIAKAEANSKVVAYPIVKRKEVERYKGTYLNLMSSKQRENAEPWPKFPPAPKSSNNEPKTGFIKIKGEAHYYVTINKQTTYYNKNGYETSKDGDILSTTQVNASDVIPNQYITKIYSENQVIIQFKDDKPDTKYDIMDIPSPPIPTSTSTLDHIIKMAKKGATFYYEEKIISSDEALQLFKLSKKLHITTTALKVYISK